jgi:uncharacterized protein YycO
MKKGDIILTCGVGLKGEVIEEITQQYGIKWAHSALAISKNKIIEADWNGVVIKHKITFLSQYKRFILCRPKKYINKNKLVKDAIKYLNIEYGYEQIIFNFFVLLGSKLTGQDQRLNMNYDSEGVTCSELLALCFKNQNIDIKPNIEPSMIMPIDFAFRNDLFDYQDINEDN